MLQMHKVLTEEEFNKKLQEINANAIVKFTAENCGPCVGLDVSISEFQPKYNINLIVINAQESLDLVVKYKVTGFPTCLVIDNNGDVKDKFIGYMDTNRFKEFCDAHFTN